jgi:hypothetical protein
MDTAYLLEDRAGVKLAPIVVNAVWPVLDLPPTAEVAGVTALPPEEAAALEAAASFRRRRQELQSVQVARLAEGLPLAQLILPYLFSTDLGMSELDTLAHVLRARVEALPEPA